VSYSLIKALHIISVVAWFAGLFYIFRLYVYHVENRTKPEITGLLEVMERRLYRGICMPAMVMTTAFGAWLIVLNPALLKLPWFHVKLTALAFLFGYHFYSGKVRRDLAAQEYRLSSKQCRVINEVPTVLLILIVIMVVVKPAFEFASN
jgi:putative membrane protein